MNKNRKKGFTLVELLVVIAIDSYSDTSVSVSTGVDVGDVTKVTEINYTNSSTTDSVIIRTTNGTLKINAPEGTVKHYGTCENVVIESVANESYHENGSITVSMEVKAGHVVIEPKASVKEVSVPETAAETTSVVLKENSNVQTIVLDSAKASVEVKENATVKDVVASADATKNITNNSSTTITPVTKTTVSTYQGLEDALSKGDKYIVFSNNITGNNGETEEKNTLYKFGIKIENDVIIDGAGFTFTTDAVRGIALWAENINVTIKNLKLCSTHEPCLTLNGYADGTRGVMVGDSNCTLTLDNFEIILTDSNKNEGVHYGIFVYWEVENSSVYIVNDSKIRGYSCIDLWGSDCYIKVNNSTLEGININNGSTDNYAAIVVAECASSDTIEISNSTINVIAEKSALERAARLKGEYTTIILTNTSIYASGNNAVTDIVTWKDNDENTHNKLIVNGVEKEIKLLQESAYVDETDSSTESSSSESKTQSSQES